MELLDAKNEIECVEKAMKDSQRKIQFRYEIGIPTLMIKEVW